MNLYEKLKVKKDATAEEIKKAYRKSAKENHPDKKGDPDEMQAINRAYAVLKDPDKRDRYDKYGDDGSTTNHDENSQITSIICELTLSLLRADPVNIQQSLKNVSQEWERNYLSGKRSCERDINDMENFKHRILKSPENNIVGGFIDSNIDQIKRKLRDIEKDYEIRKKALKILTEQYVYKEKENPMDPQGSRFIFTTI